MKKVFIGIPNTGTVVIGLAEIVCHWVAKNEVAIVPYFSRYHKPMQFNRNHIVNQFLKTDCEYLLWIDDDVVPPPNALTSLLAHEVDAVTAMCFCVRTDQHGLFVPYPVTMKDASNGEFDIYYPTQPLEEIDACGGGCVLVHRRVYEHSEMKIPYQHQYRENGELGMTCDFAIWRRAKKLGFKLYADNTVHCSHIRDMDLKQFNDTLVVATGQGTVVNA